MHGELSSRDSVEVTPTVGGQGSVTGGQSPANSETGSHLNPGSWIRARGGEALTQFFLAVCPGSGLDGASKPRCHTGSRGPRPLQEGVPPTLQCVLMKGTTVRPVTQIRILEIIHGGPWRPLLMPNGSSGNPLSSISFQSATSSRSGILREGPCYGFLPR